MKNRNRKKTNSNDQLKAGSIALVDILASGAIVLIIMLFFSISENKKNEKDKGSLEQEISITMARRVANLLQMGEIPVIGPLVVISKKEKESRENSLKNKIKKTHIKITNNGLIIPSEKIVLSKKEILKENNLLDIHLSSLKPLEKQNITLEISNIDLFYITESILREHNANTKFYFFKGSLENKKNTMEDLVNYHIKSKSYNTNQRKTLLRK